MAMITADLVAVYPGSTWALAAVILVSGIFLFNAIYNLFLHPLSPIPGPKLWAASYIPYTLVWLTGRLPFVVHSLHEKYGDVVRLTPSRVSFTHPDAWNAIRGHRKAGQGENGKDPLFYAMTRQNILGANRADHNRFRRILAHGFSAKAMQDQQPLITKYVDLLIARLRERTGSQKEENGQTKQPRPAVVDLAAWFNFTTFDVIGDLSFGEPFGCLESSQYHPWVYAILNGVKQFGPIMAIRFHFPPVLFDLIRVLSRVSPKSYFGKHWETQTEFARQKIAKRRRLGESRPDFAEAMLKAKSDDGRMLTEEELASNARLLVLAGSETTATALTGAAYFLATHPDVQRKLAEEVRSSFKAEGDIDYFSVNQLKYMLAVLDESMRMYPPVPSNLPRVCMPGGDVILGYRVPEGTHLDIWPWAMNYSSRNFTSPNEFIPERWLDQNEHQGRRFDKERHSAFQPFSVGPRNCIGKNLAYVEMRLILARLLWNFDLSLADEASTQLTNGQTFSLWVKKPLNVRLTPVVRSHV